MTIAGVRRALSSPWAGVVGLLLVAGSLLASGEGYDHRRLQLGDGAAWLATEDVGTLVHLSGVTASVDWRASFPEEFRGDELEVVQDGPSTWVVDRTRDVAWALDPVTLALGEQRGLGADHVALVAMGSSLVELTATSARLLDPATLATTGDPVDLDGAPTSWATTVDGVLVTTDTTWLLLGADGPVVSGVLPDGPATATGTVDGGALVGSDGTVWDVVADGLRVRGSSGLQDAVVMDASASSPVVWQADATTGDIVGVRSDGELLEVSVAGPVQSPLLAGGTAVLVVGGDGRVTTATGDGVVGAVDLDCDGAFVGVEEDGVLLVHRDRGPCAAVARTDGSLVAVDKASPGVGESDLDEGEIDAEDLAPTAPTTIVPTQQPAPPSEAEPTPTATPGPTADPTPTEPVATSTDGPAASATPTEGEEGASLAPDPDGPPGPSSGPVAPPRPSPPPPAAPPPPPDPGAPAPGRAPTITGQGFDGDQRLIAVRTTTNPVPGGSTRVELLQGGEVVGSAEVGGAATTAIVTTSRLVGDVTARTAFLAAGLVGPGSPSSDPIASPDSAGVAAPVEVGGPANRVTIELPADRSLAPSPPPHGAGDPGRPRFSGSSTCAVVNTRTGTRKDVGEDGRAVFADAPSPSVFRWQCRWEHGGWSAPSRGGVEASHVSAEPAGLSITVDQGGADEVRAEVTIENTTPPAEGASRFRFTLIEESGEERAPVDLDRGSSRRYGVTLGAPPGTTVRVRVDEEYCTGGDCVVLDSVLSRGVQVAGRPDAPRSATSQRILNNRVEVVWQGADDNFSPITQYIIRRDGTQIGRTGPNERAAAVSSPSAEGITIAAENAFGVGEAAAARVLVSIIPDPGPDPSPSETETGEPSPTPTATSTEEPSPTPTPTATRSPTEEPSPTPTATATSTEEPTPTPTATATDEPSPTPTSTDQRASVPPDEAPSGEDPVEGGRPTVPLTDRRRGVVP